MTEIDGIRTWSYVHKNKVIHKISEKYVKACRRKVRKTVTDGRTDGHHHTIIRPVWRRAYKNWGIHSHFYNKWVQNLTFSWNYWYIKTASVIVLPKCCNTTKRSFFLLYSICHQVQGHLHLNKSIVPWIESLITTQRVLFCPYERYLPFWKIKKFGFFSIANPVLSYFQYIFADCFTSKLRKIKRKDKEIKKIIFDSEENDYRETRTHDPWFQRPVR